MAGRPLPVTDDPDTGPFFAAARRRELVVQMCNECDAVLHLPRAYCAACGSWDTRWQPTSGRGRVYSWVVAEHQVHPAFEVPYTIVLVELEEHPDARFLGYLPGRVELQAGEEMRVWFEELDEGVVLPQWARAASD